MNRRDFSRLHAHEYEGPRLRNPFFIEGPDRLRRIGCFIAAIVLPFGTAFIFLFGPFMQYRDVQVEGLTTLPVEDVRETAWSVLEARIAFALPGTNIIIARDRLIERRLQEAYHFDELSIYREGLTLRIVAKERITEIAWLSAEKAYLVDLEGIVLQEAPAEAAAMVQARLARAEEIPPAAGLQPTMPIIVDGANTPISVGESTVGSDSIQDVLALDEGLRLRSMLPVRYLFADSQRLWIDVALPETTLYVDLQAPVDETLGYLDAFLQEHREDLASYSYVDLRFANHIYTKPR